MEEELDLRQQKTRAALVGALFEILKTQDPDSCIKVLDICRQAKITYMTFYAHFHNKFELLRYCVRSQFENKFPIPIKLKPRSLKQLTLYLVNFLTQYSYKNKDLIINSLKRRNYSGCKNNYLDIFYKALDKHFLNELCYLYKKSSINTLAFLSSTITSALFNWIVKQIQTNKKIDPRFIFDNLKVMAACFNY